MVPKIRTVSACCPGFTTSTNGSTCVPLCRSGWSDLLLSAIFWSDLADSLEKDFYKMVSDWEHLKVSGNKRLWWLPWASKTPQNGKSYCRLLAKSSILWKFKMRIWMRRRWLLRWMLSRCRCIMIGYNHDHHHQLKIIAHCDDKAGIFMGLWLCEIHSVWDTEALPGPAPSLDPLPVVSWSSSLSWQLAILVLLVAMALMVIVVHRLWNVPLVRTVGRFSILRGSDFSISLSAAKCLTLAILEIIFNIYLGETDFESHNPWIQ